MSALRRAALAVWATAVLAGCAHLAPGLEPEDLARLPRRAELSAVPFFPQREYQCGPAALAAVLASSGLAVTDRQLEKEVYLPGRQGSLQAELVAASRARDRLPYELAPQPAALLEEVAAGRPVLVLQNLGWEIAPVWHFAVLIGFDLDAGRVVLRSGTTERLEMSLGKFVRTWDRAGRWAMVVLAPDELPADPEPQRYLRAAAGLEAIGRLEAAARAYARAHERWPDSVWPVLGLANIDYARGDLASAQNGYFAALALDDTNVIAHNNLAEILAGRGCREEARAHIERARQLAAGTTLEPAVAATSRKIASMPDSESESCSASATR